jgi:hypothetical protein
LGEIWLVVGSLRVYKKGFDEDVFSFGEYNLAFFGLAQLFWLLYIKFGRSFPNLLVTLAMMSLGRHDTQQST